MQHNHSAQLKVYAVWINFYPWDSRSDIDPAILRDSRVTQYWDPDKIAPHWFADRVLDERGQLAWDVYFLYGPDSRWDVAPSNLMATGSPVIADFDSLEKKLATA